ncbi:MAG TPA: nucleotidyl transferase AbiEii/AbiGii toxin family protein [Tepidisphaeraceae bacterium]|nr:nucleotidyl transferase AbiEii/AbiGii toxin family protein [Tepidisphaeraceae bacterium]
MVGSRIDYPDLATEAARMVMLELVRILGEYKDSIAIVGGWVPELLFANAQPKHVGSIDVDIALDHRTIDADVYRTIREHLAQHGYEEGSQPFIFFRTVTIGSQAVKVQVDFLAGEYQGTSKSHRHQTVQSLKARKARGSDLVFKNMTEQVKIEGHLPNGAVDSATVKVAGIVPFIVMKAMALADRIKAKDAWDIWFCLQNFLGGNPALALAFQPHLHNKLVQEALAKIADKFQSTAHFGPQAVADFDDLPPGDDRDRRIRDAFERVDNLLNRLKAQ